MDMNLIRIRENFLKRMTETFYIGPGSTSIATTPSATARWIWMRRRRW